ncbi:MAG: hypothetical protein VYC67_02760 [Pseudomonadota bacterium]|nr:hypothetical protein [Pseudomonadota bacterium]
MSTDILTSEVPWNTPYQEIWKRSLESNRIPHALLLIGGEGIGKRAFAEWIIKQHLKIDYNSHTSMHPYSIPQHADSRWIQLDDEKTMISIDQIRDLIDDLSLTSYEGIGKIGVIDPLNKMSFEASSSLLKTLEEPSGNTLMILIADRRHNIPATIISRCQVIRMTKPDREQSISWLEQTTGLKDCSNLSDYFLGSPLNLMENYDQIKNISEYEKRLMSILKKNESPLDLALDLSKEDPVFVLDWMSNFIGCLIKGIFVSDIGLTKKFSNFQEKLSESNLFLFLDKINKLRNQPQGSYNFQMVLEGLLIDWHCGLHEIKSPQGEYNELPSVIFKSAN